MATTSRGMPMNIHRVGVKMPMSVTGMKKQMREERDMPHAAEEHNPSHREPKSTRKR